MGVSRSPLGVELVVACQRRTQRGWTGPWWGLFSLLECVGFACCSVAARGGRRNPERGQFHAETWCSANTPGRPRPREGPADGVGVQQAAPALQTEEVGVLWWGWGGPV